MDSFPICDICGADVELIPAPQFLGESISFFLCERHADVIQKIIERMQNGPPTLEPVDPVVRSGDDKPNDR